MSNEQDSAWWLLMVRGVLAVALGLATLFWPSATLSLLVRLIGMYVLFDIGLILLSWPDATGRLLMVVVGIWALLQSGALFFAARRGLPGIPIAD